MLFCPTCANLLLIEKTHSDFRFFCKTCPYIFVVTQTFEKKMNLERKEVDDVLGGKEAWADVEQIEAECGRCGHRRAYFMQIQIRSADEPMTTFYKCSSCAHQWREN
jgi:DNA-directed RNA polymerase III subunit RPC11